MKKGEKIILLIFLTFLILTIGIFIGRNTNTEVMKLNTYDTPSVTYSADPRLDINTLSEVQLVTLPGIGETLARRIVAYRDKYGPFQSMDDLLMVEGIGEAKLEQIINLVKIGE